MNGLAALDNRGGSGGAGGSGGCAKTIGRSGTVVDSEIAGSGVKGFALTRIFFAAVFSLTERPGRFAL